MKLYPPLYDSLKDWPIYKFTQRREEFIRELDAYTLKHFENLSAERLKEILLQTAYKEKQRIKNDSWKIDPPKEENFWNKVQHKANEVNLENEIEAKKELLHFVEVIVNRYSQEIVGGFKISTFKFMRKFLTWLFHRLLNTARTKSLKGLFINKHQLYEKLRVSGQDLPLIRQSCKEGTLVVIPTHFSNLDSILVGYAMDAVLGLPAFLYSAGLNLFNYGIPAYFMNRLGAYRLDRRKRNHIYLQTLKSMSEFALIQDINSLFFAGGTRSRSGELESRLKLGLLGTTISAQRKLYAQGSDRKIYIAPLIISYNFVLEGKHLIHQFLKTEGREKYSYTKDKSHKIRHILNFIWCLFRKDSEIVLSFAPVMDVLGNRVTSNGASVDKKGQEVDIKQYFVGENGIEAHKQREEIYTKRLSENILASFRQYNIVLPSHLLSFVAFEALMKKYDHLDFYQVLHLSSDEAILDYKQFEQLVTGLRNILLKKAADGELLLHDKITEGVGECIKSGLEDIGIYHPQKPIVKTRDNKIVSQDITLLYYYRNRLNEYGLKKEMQFILDKEAKTIE